MRYVNYRYWFVASLIASTGAWLQRVAQDWYVLTVLTDHDSGQVGIVTALQFLPIILFSASAGVLADRIPGRRLLQCTQAGVGLVSLVMGVVVLTGTGEPLAPVHPRLRLRDDLRGRHARTPGIRRRARAPGQDGERRRPERHRLPHRAPHWPGFGGFLHRLVGVGPVFLIDAGMFAAPVIALALMRADRLYPRTLIPRARGQLREGIAYVRGRTDICIILVTIFVVSALGMNFQLTSALMATTVFGKSAGSFGVLSTFMALGSILGSTAVARRSPRLRAILMGAAFYGTAEILLGLSPSYWWFAVLAVPTGYGMLTMNTSANALMQTRTDPDKRGRIMALYSLVYLGATPIGSPIIGRIGALFGARWAILVGGIASLSIAVACEVWAMIHWKARVVRRSSFPWVGIEGDSSVDAPSRSLDED